LVDLLLLAAAGVKTEGYDTNRDTKPFDAAILSLQPLERMAGTTGLEPALPQNGLLIPKYLGDASYRLKSRMTPISGISILARSPT
jgi:hypothetical protein